MHFKPVTKSLGVTFHIDFKQLVCHPHTIGLNFASNSLQTFKTKSFGEHDAMTRHYYLATTLLITLLSAYCAPAITGEHSAKIGTSKPEVLYHNYCSVCHGDRGDGNSRAKNSLVPPPKDFTRAPELTRDTMITIITHGKTGTAMTGWKTQLNDKDIAGLADYIWATFMQVSLDPRLQRGRVVYTQNCMVCHGDRGQGATSGGGLIPPRDFTTPQARAELNRERMLSAVTNGRANTAMAPFASRLPEADIEAVVDYVRIGLMLPATSGISGTSAHAKRGEQSMGEGMNTPFSNGLIGNPSKGEKMYMANCATCHGIKGDGKGPRAYFITPKPRNFIDKNFRLAFNRPAIFTAVHDGRLGAEMPAWSKVLTDQEMTDVSEFVFRRFVQKGAK